MKLLFNECEIAPPLTQKNYIFTSTTFTSLNVRFGNIRVTSLSHASSPANLWVICWTFTNHQPAAGAGRGGGDARGESKQKQSSISVMKKEKAENDRFQRRVHSPIIDAKLCYLPDKLLFLRTRHEMNHRTGCLSQFGQIISRGLTHC